MKVEWESQCHYGVKRKIAAQHGNCASCPYYQISQHGWPNKCDYWIAQSLSTKVRK